ncbi:MAG: hypothetical protein IPH22_02370 [Nitrosomonas sp.]|nr:hypothetical protein [Nitrosomonas sp.]
MVWLSGGGGGGLVGRVCLVVGGGDWGVLCLVVGRFCWLGVGVGGLVGSGGCAGASVRCGACAAGVVLPFAVGACLRAWVGRLGSRLLRGGALRRWRA